MAVPQLTDRLSLDTAPRGVSRSHVGDKGKPCILLRDRSTGQAAAAESFPNLTGLLTIFCDDCPFARSSGLNRDAGCHSVYSVAVD